MHRFLALLIVILALLSGCGPSEAPMGKVHGTVTLDGVPVDNGNIEFQVDRNVGNAARLEIKNGHYEGPAVIGFSRVLIRAYKVVGQHPKYPGDPNSPMMDEMEQTMPPQFNDMSPLQVEVKAGDNQFDFPLKTK